MRHRLRKRPVAEMNVVPYIDVMLVMLVIFMVTAPLLNQGVEVELPTASARPLAPEQQDPLVVSVDAEGQLFLNIGGDPAEPVSDEDLQLRAAAVLRRRPDVAVMVRGDRSVAYQHVVRAMVLLQGAGAGNVGLVTDLPGKGR
ncbi:MAG: protein TolR [Gammaproteobacteria bacterium]|nr:protein TolR [Gammaproteobacteria bacterium]